MSAPFNQYTIGQLFDDLSDAESMIDYWQSKNNQSGITAWGYQVEKIKNRLAYIADRLEFFAKMNPSSKPAFNVMSKVNEIREAIK